MRAIILTEGGRQNGFGHITRCLALRDAFEVRGISAKLVINADSKIDREIFTHSDYFLNWLRAKNKLLTLIQKAEIVVLDSYLAKENLYKVIANKVPVPVYIDDYVRISYPRGIVLNGTVDAEKLRYPKNRSIRHLLGSRYVLVRKEFWNIRNKRVRPEIKDIFVTFGGIHRPQFVQKLIEYLAPRFRGCRFHAVVSREVQKISSEKNVSSHERLHAAEMKKLMLRCDVAICGGGQTTNELAACGLPIIGVRLAKNQNPNIRGWQQSGVLMLAGSPSDPKLFLKINRILQTMTWRERKCIAQMGQKLLDGKGALRAVQGILKLGLYVQKTWKKQKCADPPA